jgi:uncharacterized protein (DUF1800 family)
VGLTAFDEATAVTPDGDGWYSARPDERFAIVSGDGSVGAVNGGVLLATVLRAVLDTSPHPDPVATSAHFLRVPRLAPARIQVTWLKQGRTAVASNAHLVLAQLENHMLEGNVSEQTDAIISRQLDDPRISQRRLDDAPRPPNVGILAGLLLGSPEFQRR